MRINFARWGDDIIVSKNILIGCTHKNAMVAFSDSSTLGSGLKPVFFLARKTADPCGRNVDTKSWRIQLNPSPRGWPLRSPKWRLNYLFDFTFESDYTSCLRCMTFALYWYTPLYMGSWRINWNVSRGFEIAKKDKTLMQMYITNTNSIHIK